MKRLLTSIGILSVTLALWAQHDERELADPVPCNKEAWQSVKIVTLAWGSIDVRYSRSEVPVLTPVKRMSVHGWRGERLNVQAVLTTPKAIKQVKLDMSDLKSGRNLIPASSVNKFSVATDLNKLLVPTYPKQRSEETDNDYTDRVQRDYYDISPIAGIFKSFHDAPNGFKEEMEEIQWSMGCEYTYNDRFMLRGGYHHEAANKGNRKYFTVGAGFHMSVFSVDAAYVFSTSQSNPLDQTMRFTLGFDLDGMRDLFGRRR